MRPDRRRYTSYMVWGVGLLMGSPAAAQQCIPAWDASLGQPGANAEVVALLSTDALGIEALYVGGQFKTIGGIAASGVVQWRGGEWSPLGEGVEGDVKDFAVYDDGTGPALYVAGTFEKAGGILASNIARWDGESWSPLGFFGNGTFGTIITLVVFDEDGDGPQLPALFLGGTFSLAGGVEANHVARWDGVSFSPLGTGLKGAVWDLAVHDDGAGAALYAVGDFSGEFGGPRYIAQWNGTTWSDVGDGLNYQSRALATFDFGNGPELVVGGDFTEAGGVSALRLARWNGQVWSALAPLGDGVDKAVVVLEAFDDGNGAALYAGGGFSQTGSGVLANRIIGWRDGEWFPLADGLDSQPEALTVLDKGPTSKLIVGGTFFHADNIPADRIAAWGCESACYPDFTGDGTLDLFDFLAYVNAFNAGNGYADCTGDGELDLFDFLCFVNAFNEECP